MYNYIVKIPRKDRQSVKVRSEIQNLFPNVDLDLLSLPGVQGVVIEEPELILIEKVNINGNN